MMKMMETSRVFLIFPFVRVWEMKKKIIEFWKKTGFWRVFEKKKFLRRISTLFSERTIRTEFWDFRFRRKKSEHFQILELFLLEKIVLSEKSSHEISRKLLAGQRGNFKLCEYADLLFWKKNYNFSHAILENLLRRVVLIEMWRKTGIGWVKIKTRGKRKQLIVRSGLGTLPMVPDDICFWFFGRITHTKLRD